MDAASKKQQQPKKGSSCERSKTDSVRVAKVKKLFEDWLLDSSGYDEEAWPQIKQSLNENHSTSHNLFDEKAYSARRWTAGNDQPSSL